MKSKETIIIAADDSINKLLRKWESREANYREVLAMSKDDDVIEMRAVIRTLRKCLEELKQVTRGKAGV